MNHPYLEPAVAPVPCVVGSEGALSFLSICTAPPYCQKLLTARDITIADGLHQQGWLSACSPSFTSVSIGDAKMADTQPTTLSSNVAASLSGSLKEPSCATLEAMAEIPTRGCDRLRKPRRVTEPLHPTHCLCCQAWTPSPFALHPSATTPIWFALCASFLHERQVIAREDDRSMRWCQSSPSHVNQSAGARTTIRPPRLSPAGCPTALLRSFTFSHCSLCQRHGISWISSFTPFALTANACSSSRSFLGKLGFFSPRSIARSRRGSTSKGRLLRTLGFFVVLPPSLS